MAEQRRASGLRLAAHWGLVFVDLAVGLLAITMAFVVRFSFDERIVPMPYLAFYLRMLPLIIVPRVLIYHWFGLYRQVWSLVSLPEMGRVVMAVSAESAVCAITLLLPGQGFPRSVIAIAWLFKTVGMGGVRILARMFSEWKMAHGLANSNGRGGVGDAVRTLVFGAGAGGALLVRELAHHPELGLQIIGFIDDAPPKQQRAIAGIPVLGTRRDLERICREQAVKQLIIAVPSAGGRVVREVSEAGRRIGLKVKTVPGLYELVDGSAAVTRLRDIQIEDLLGRPEVDLDLAAIAEYLTDQVVLVTGAGGSIGSELCRQVARFKPRQLLLLGHGENSIYEINLELGISWPDLATVPLIADIQDEARINEIFSQYRPDVVFHAAAHKHVPLMEQNPGEAIKNNVFGTLNMVQAADRHGVKRFVMISTDKAVNPTSVMGASKAAAEQVVRAYAETSGTVFVAVRFGNVLGSRGSVVPLFRRQIAAGGPVTVTDPQMTRYFMTIPEAAQLVIQSAAMGKGGEVFILDMGDPVRIDALARDMIRLAGYEPDEDIAVVYTGLRPGEKLNEELASDGESVSPTSHAKITLAQNSRSATGTTLTELLRSLREVAVNGQDQMAAKKSIISATKGGGCNEAAGGGC